jgi:predicted GNAT superfamily acetyltransferase
MHYRQADDEYFSIVEECGPEVFSKLSSTAFPQSYRAMVMFCAKTNSLKTAMFDCIDSNNPYSFKVLFRCFCEHYLKFMYVWTRFVAENADLVGVEYYSFCGASEARDYVSAIAMAEGLLGNSVTADIQAAIAQLYPDAAKLSTRELEQASSRFKYRSILRFLGSDELQFVAKERPFLAQIIPAYALLSSFVHGGPYTDMEMMGYSEPRALEDCEREAEVAFLMTATVFMLTAAAVSKEYVELRPVAGRVKNLIDRFLSGTSRPSGSEGTI